MTRLYVGNYNYSSWSLRAWLCLRWGGIPFEEVLVDLDQPGYGQGAIGDVLAVSPSGRLPVLHTDDGTVIWDSLAIAEWAAEHTSTLWPRDARGRAEMRSLVCEMHSGFAALRAALPMNLRTRARADGLSAAALADVARLESAWSRCRERHGNDGPYLGGQRGIVDAFFTPIAARFESYGVALSADAARYRDTVLADPDFRAWRQAAAGSEKVFSRARLDDLYPPR